MIKQVTTHETQVVITADNGKEVTVSVGKSGDYITVDDDKGRNLYIGISGKGAEEASKNYLEG